MKLFSSPFRVVAIFLFVLVLISTGFIRGGRAQVGGRPFTVAPGYEINVFADVPLVPDFNGPGFGPTSMAFDSQGRLFVGTGSGKILILLDTNDDGVVDQVKTFATGMSLPLGLAFRSNGDLYATTNPLVTGGRIGRVIRLRDTNGDDVADDIAVLVDNLPSQGQNNTDKLRFGPDGKLYFGQGSTSDNGTPPPGIPPDGPLNAAILQIDPDNPPAGGQATQSNVFATGLRNPFGMGFDPVSGALFCTDEAEGEIPEASPPDKLNWVIKGANYGFPGCNGVPDPSNPACAGVTAPLLTFIPHSTPTAVGFYTGPQAGTSLNHVLVTVFKFIQAQGGDLEQFILTGDSTHGFQVASDPNTPQIASFGVIDPGDGPVDIAIDPISGDIYVARIDTVAHADPTEHHNAIYRIHKSGSDNQPFIGPVNPSTVQAGSGQATITVTGRHLQTGAQVNANGTVLTTRRVDLFHLSADVPASLTANPGTINIAVRNADWMMSNAEPLVVAPPPQPAPHINSMTVMKKSGKVVKQVFVGVNFKKFRLVVDGSNFDQGAQLMVNGTPLVLVNSSATELVGSFNAAMVAAPGTLTVQVKDGNGQTSNTLSLAVSAASQ